jgi:hypothetical protein
MPYHSSGEVMMIKDERCIGILGGSFVSQKEKEGWDLEIFTLSIWLCWRSKYGG